MQEDPEQRVAGEGNGFWWREKPTTMDVFVPVRELAQWCDVMVVRRHTDR
jgi:hypothetical protein